MTRVVLALVAAAAVLGLTGSAGAGDDKSAGGKVAKVDKEKGTITLALKVGDKEVTKTFSHEDVVVVSTEGKKVEGKAVLAALREQDPIWIPDFPPPTKKKLVINVLKKE